MKTNKQTNKQSNKQEEHSIHTLYSLKYEFNCLVMAAKFGLINGFSIQQEDINPYLKMWQESMLNFGNICALTKNVM